MVNEEDRVYYGDTSDVLTRMSELEKKNKQLREVLAVLMLEIPLPALSPDGRAAWVQAAQMLEGGGE